MNINKTSSYENGTNFKEWYSICVSGNTALDNKHTHTHSMLEILYSRLIESLRHCKKNWMKKNLITFNSQIFN